MGFVPVLVASLSKVAFEGTGGGGRRLSCRKENLSSKDPPPGGELVYMAPGPSSGVPPSVSVSSPVSFMLLSAKMLSILDFIVGLIIDMKIILRIYRGSGPQLGSCPGLLYHRTGASGSV